jgi:hypothetical protein
MPFDFVPKPLMGGLLCGIGLFLCSAANAVAQITNFGSPYSRFGMGEYQPLTGAAYQAMGGMHAALSHPQLINSENPAALAKSALTRFEISTQARFSYLQTTTSSLLKSNINLAQVALAIPVGKSFGTALSFSPLSQTNYDVKGDGLVDPGGGQLPYVLTEYYTGRGGFNRLSWGWGWQVRPSLRAGYALNLLFGQSIREFRRVFPDSVQSFNVRIQDQWSVNDLYHQVGLQWQPVVKPEAWSGTWGLGLRLPARLNLRQNLLGERYTLIAGTVRIRDTVYQMPELQGKMEWPLQVSLGYWGEKPGKWGWGTELQWEALSGWKAMGSPDSLQDRLVFRMGTFVVPNPNAAGRPLQHAVYRAGFRYSPGALRLRQTSIPEAALSLGMGLPLRRSASMLQFSLEAGQWGLLKEGLMREHFLRLYLSVNLNDRWFIKRVYD